MFTLSPVLFAMWFVTILAETSRTPFDFREGESELVSGFNTEYSSGLFAFFFLAEYGRILFIRFFLTIVFLSSSDFRILYSLKALIIVFIFVWVRATLPRLRYDKLINFA